jgi:hypothetical protein
MGKKECMRFYNTEINIAETRTEEDIAKLGCRMLMKDGIPLVAGVVVSPAPLEEPKGKRTSLGGNGYGMGTRDERERERQYAAQRRHVRKKSSEGR